jgi:hypothetical protein
MESQLLGEMWRYTAITWEPLVPRSRDWFSPGQYVACRIDDGYIAGRIIEIAGFLSPPILKICMYQGNGLCFGHSDGCDSNCRKRLLTPADHAGVLNLQDLFVVLDNPDPIDPIDPRHRIMDYAQAEALFHLIDNLERRQKSC